MSAPPELVAVDEAHQAMKRARARATAAAADYDRALARWLDLPPAQRGSSVSELARRFSVTPWSLRKRSARHR